MPKPLETQLRPKRQGRDQLGPKGKPAVAGTARSKPQGAQGRRHRHLGPRQCSILGPWAPALGPGPHGPRNRLRSR